MSKTVLFVDFHCTGEYILDDSLEGKWPMKHFNSNEIISNSSPVHQLLYHQIPKSNKNMFDECPWPFTLFHDPVKFLKDSSTWIVLVWVALCQVYSFVMKVRAGGA
jgi:hypothetical protein